MGVALGTRKTRLAHRVLSDGALSTSTLGELTWLASAVLLPVGQYFVHAGHLHLRKRNFIKEVLKTYTAKPHDVRPAQVRHLINYSVGALEEATERQVEEFVHHISQKQVEARTCLRSSAPDKRRYMQRYEITSAQMQRLTLSLTWPSESHRS